MGTFSPIHWLIVLLMVVPLLALLIVPAWRIFQRAGFSGAWALLMLVPLVGMLALWILSFVKWPSDTEGRTRTNKLAIAIGVLMLPLSIGAIFAFSAASVRDVATVEQRAQQQPDRENGIITPPAPSEDGPWKKYQK